MKKIRANTTLSLFILPKYLRAGRMRIVLTLLIYCLTSQPAAWGGEITLFIGAHGIHADIANTQYSRARGLMSRQILCENCGMLFIFPKPGKHNFWMKDTPLPLSIAFIDAGGSILNIAEMEANTLKSYYSRGAALYALEMNKGWFTEHAIKPGEIVHGLHHAPRGK